MSVNIKENLALEVELLTVKLGSYIALENVSFSVPQRSFTAILGPNGSGKTTLLKAILGIIPAERGSVKVYGSHLSDISPLAIGYVPQIKTMDRTFPATTCDLVASGMLRRWPSLTTHCVHGEVHIALDMVGAGHLIHKPVGKLSGGELQRVYLARALVRKPRILILDEPATGIDAVGEDDMNRILDNFIQKESVTVLMVTHDWLSARHHASHVLLMNRLQIAFGEISTTLTAKNLDRTFGHIGHIHEFEDTDHD